jgi:hypothetical protein
MPPSGLPAYLADVQQGFDRPDQSETEDQLVAFAQHAG